MVINSIFAVLAIAGRDCASPSYVFSLAILFAGVYRRLLCVCARRSANIQTIIAAIVIGAFFVTTFTVPSPPIIAALCLLFQTRCCRFYLSAIVIAVAILFCLSLSMPSYYHHCHRHLGWYGLFTILRVFTSPSSLFAPLSL